jgi:MerR family transcriptional regulator, light-induced transcriptional regulator
MTLLETDRRQAAAQVRARLRPLAESVVAHQFAHDPALQARFGDAGRLKCQEDAVYHLQYLAESLHTGRQSIFDDYLRWAQGLLAQYGVPASDFAAHLQAMAQVLRQELSGPAAAAAAQVVMAGAAAIPPPAAAAPPDLPTELPPGAPLGALARSYIDALLAGDRQAASRMVLQAVQSGTPVREIYLDVFQPSQREVGRLWHAGRVSVAQEHFCTAATQLVMSQLYPWIFSGDKGAGTLVATCVAGDLHEIGVRMVADFFEMAGWDTYFLGASTPTRDVLRTLLERSADALAVSATMPYHVHQVESLIQALRADPRHDATAVIVGGRAFNHAAGLWREIGADAHALDAAGAIDVAAELKRAGRPS